MFINKKKEKTAMIEITNLENWTKDYFSQPENQAKAKKACERYDRLMVKNIRKMLQSGEEEININDIAAEDPGKRLERVKFESIPAKLEGKKGTVRINLIDQTTEFLTE